MDNIPLSVLYVDDETTLLDLGKLFLERNKAIHVDIASSASDALAMLACKSYDAIISDYQMPEIDGIELLKEVRRLFGDIPFILFTGRGREEVVIQAINHGADFYLQKGGEPKSQFVELEHKVRQAVTRRKAEHSLIESERTSRALLDATTDAVALITEDLTILAVNDAFARRFGREPDQMTGKNLHEYIPPDLSRDRIARVHEVIATKNPVRFEDIRGELFLENSFYPIFDEQGEVFRLAMYSRDITDRKRAEQDLHTAYEQIASDEEELREKYNELSQIEMQIRESEGRLLMAQEIGGIGSWEYYFEKNRIWGSAEASSIYGFPPVARDYPIDEIESCVIDRERIHQIFIDFLNGNREYDIEISINPADDSPPKVVHSIARLEKDDQNNPVKVVGVIQDITHRKRAEDELHAAYEQIAASEASLKENYQELLRSEQVIRESESWFRGLFDQAFQLAGVLDISGRVTQINQTALSLIGIDLAVVLNVPFWETPWWMHDTEVQNKIKDAIHLAQRGELVRFDTTLQDGAGKIHNIDFSLKPLTDKSGVVIGLLPEGRDITLLKSIEADLLKSREKFKSFFDHSHEAIFIHDAEGKILDVNATMCQMYKVSYEDALRYTIGDYTGPESDMSEVHLHWERVLSGEDQIFPWQARRPIDGSLFDVEVYLSKIENDGEPLIQGNVHDLTASKRAEELIRKSEERYRSLVETTGTGYVVLDLQGKVLDANEEYIRLTGRSSLEEISGRSVTEWTAPYDLEQNGEGVRKCIQNGFIRDLEIDYIHPDGTVQPLEINASVVGSESGDIILTLCRDIHVRKSFRS